MLLAVQCTYFPLSILFTIFWRDDVVLSKPLLSFVVFVEYIVMSVDDMNHLMVDFGLQYDDVQLRFIHSPATTSIVIGANLTDVTLTVLIKKKYICIKVSLKQ